MYRNYTFQFLLALIISAAPFFSKACNLADFRINNQILLANGNYQLDMTFSGGGGRQGIVTGGDNVTAAFGFLFNGNINIVSSPNTIFSPQTGAAYAGTEQATPDGTYLVYQPVNNGDLWISLASGYPIAQISYDISIVVDALPTHIDLLAIEGVGNLAAGCPLRVYPDTSCKDSFIVKAGPDTLVYLNQSPVLACVDLTATLNPLSVQGNFAYSWSNGSSSPTTTVCPTEPTTYFVTVIDSSNGCGMEDDVFVDVDSTVGLITWPFVCYQGLTYTVDPQLVHLVYQQGGTPGPCVFGPGPGLPPSVQPGLLPVVVSPNPLQPKIQVSFEIEQKDVVTIRLRDMQGQLKAQLLQQQLEDGKHTFEFVLPPLASGFYLLEILVGSKALHSEKVFQP